MKKYEMLFPANREKLLKRWKSIKLHAEKGISFGWDGPYGNYGKDGDRIDPAADKDLRAIVILDEIITDILKP